MPYAYVGPERIRREARTQPAGTPIRTNAELRAWLTSHPDAASEGATYTVGLDGVLRLAPRRSEHVACASGEEVLAAGEIVLDEHRVTSVTNQSTGYCPDPACWPAVAAALAPLDLHPSGWTLAFILRRCACGQVNLVKDDWYVCALCGRDLD